MTPDRRALRRLQGDARGAAVSTCTCACNHTAVGPTSIHWADPKCPTHGNAAAYEQVAAKEEG